MVEGYLQGQSVRPLTPATIVWIDEISGMSAELGHAGPFAWSKSPKFPGFQCEQCGLIELRPPPAESEELDGENP
jgi:hypothetical protein